MDKEARKESIYYDNKNAKSNCPKCDSLETYFHKEKILLPSMWL